uniref:BRCA1-associated RING domain protein 1 n=1 Tax=Parascaris univalens TaxID=6257 RepID=A0A915BSD7_PARUN
SCDNFFRISSVRMFANTLKETHNFLRSIRCDRCRTSSDNLQFLGQSCKHVFCWSCINEMFTGESFVQCPLCALPLDLRHPSPATSINQFFQHLLSLKEHLSKLDVTKVNKHELAILAEPDRQKRTVDEFCATQRMALIGGDLDEEEEDFRQEAALAECDDQSSARTFEEGSVISNESSRVKKAIDDALKRNDVAVEGLLRQYAASAHCTSSHSASSAQGNTLPKEISDGLQLGHPSAGVKLFSQLSQETKYPEDMEITSMTQQLPIFKEPDEYIFFKRRPSATFAKGAVNLRGMEVKNAYNGDEFAGHASGTVTHMTRNRSRLSHRKGENVLITAAVTGRRQLMVEALESGEDANQRDKSGYTAMHHAAAVNSLDLCKILVENGAVINAYGEFSFLRFCVLSPTDFLILSEANFDLLK